MTYRRFLHHVVVIAWLSLSIVFAALREIHAAKRRRRIRRRVYA
ncbi:MAG TPA: hypothetical protein VMU09_04110 [Acidimicrobiales bacterium]|nr:hypothetical protein [Acidimicrobiales bacterium]